MNARGTLTAVLLVGLLLVAFALAAPSGARPAHPSAKLPCHYETDKILYRRVRMSDVHGWKGVSATFKYATEDGADTFLDWAVQSPKGVWEIGQEEQVTETKVFGQTATLSGHGDHPVTGLFRFHLAGQHGRDCPEDEGPKRFVRPYRFEGAMRIEKSRDVRRGLSGRCDRAHGHRKLYPSTTMHTGTVNSFSYEHSFRFLGLSLGSRSVFSKNVQIELANNTKHKIWVCGMSLSGAAVPPAEAAMLYAGPRVRNR